MSYPEKLQKIITLFEGLSDEDKRETLVSYANTSVNHRPKVDEKFDLEDIRKDAECTDTVGIYLKVDADRRVTFRVVLGMQVQTLTKAMVSILCKGLNGATVDEVLNVPSDFVPKIVGAQLIRARSQSVYYVLTRIKSAIKVYTVRQRQAALEADEKKSSA